MQARLIAKLLTCITLILIFAGKAFCQNNFERAIAEKVDSLLAPDKTWSAERALFPNDALQAITIPFGWGGYGTYLFGSVGGVYPQAYQTKADLIVSGGACFGNPFKVVNVAASVNLTDVHRFRDFSGNVEVSRVIAPGSSISVGGLQLFADKQESDAPQQTYYFVFSHAVQSLPSATPGCSKLTYTIGVGSGRFYLKSPADSAAGRGKNGTAIFGNISYEVIHHVNLIAEWSGVNLALAAGVRPFKDPLSLGIGVYNITRFSSDKPSMIFTLGYPLSLNRKKNGSD
jgi:hypothetical protein